jgi:hypothetical protein
MRHLHINMLVDKFTNKKKKMVEDRKNLNKIIQ